MKVLLFANDAMPFGQLPTSGGGLRCWQIYQGLRSHGIEVVASMPAFTYLIEKHYSSIPEEQRSLLWNWETQDSIVKAQKPDAIIFASNWDHYGLSKIPEVPLIIDLHGSRLIETSMWNAPVDTDRKVDIFSKADCLLTAGQRQKNYFYGWLLQAGRVPEESDFIHYIPVSLDPQQPEHFTLQQQDESFPHLVSGGGWFPWQNQSRTIFAACDEIIKRDRGRIDIFGTPHNAGASESDEDDIRAVYDKVVAFSEQSSRICVNGYVSRNELLGIYSRASVALEAMEYNLERELAFTTRTVEYLWCGLPVIYNDFGELSEHISEYDAGWCVDATSDKAIRLAFEEIFDSPQCLAQKSRNAQRLVRDRFSWDTTILPLVHFLQNPAKAPRVHSAQGGVYSRASFLNPTGTGVNVALRAEAPVVAQSCVVPAEGIRVLEVPLSIASDTQAQQGDAVVRLSLSNIAGRTLCSVEKPVDELREARVIKLPFPFWLRMKGGQEVVVRVELCKAGAEDTVLLRGLHQQRYPFTSTVNSFPGTEAIGSLSLRFGVFSSRLDKLIVYFERGTGMIRRGEWRRFLRALRSRAPALISRLLPR